MPEMIMFAAADADYGMARDETIATGIEHISLTTNPDGSPPYSTFPVADLEAVTNKATLQMARQEINRLRAEARAQFDAGTGNISWKNDAKTYIPPPQPIVISASERMEKLMARAQDVGWRFLGAIKRLALQTPEAIVAEQRSDGRMLVWNVKDGQTEQLCRVLDAAAYHNLRYNVAKSGGDVIVICLHPQEKDADLVMRYKAGKFHCDDGPALYALKGNEVLGETFYVDGRRVSASQVLEAGMEPARSAMR